MKLKAVVISDKDIQTMEKLGLSGWTTNLLGNDCGRYFNMIDERAEELANATNGAYYHHKSFEEDILAVKKGDEHLLKAVFPELEVVEIEEGFYLWDQSPLTPFPIGEIEDIVPLNGSIYDHCDMRLKIPAEIYTKIFHYINAVKAEVSGIGKIREIKGDFLVDEIRIFPQDGSGVDTFLDKQALVEFLFELAKKNQDPSNYKFWWHSHFNFGVFWSPKDKSNIQRHSQKCSFISLCINQRGDMIARYDEKGKVVDLPIVILPLADKELQRKCYQEAKKMVKVKKIGGGKWNSKDKRGLSQCKGLKKYQLL